MGVEVRVLFAGGGTGGHLFPGIAVAQRLALRGVGIGFAGTGGRLERDVTASLGFEYLEVPAVSTRDLRTRPGHAIRLGLRAWREARRAIRWFRPSVVVGLGGFTSAPVVLAAGRQGIPVTLLEQNVIPGRATRWLSRLAGCVCVSFEETIPLLPAGRRCRLTGNPVRQVVRDVSTTPAARTIVVLGGSQGARSLNRTVPRMLGRCRELAGGWRVVHQCGDDDQNAIRQAYARAGWSAEVESFIARPETWLAEAGLVIARAGATTLAELACVGCPSVLVPYPFATDDHQAANAAWFADRQAARWVKEGGGEGDFERRLGQEVLALLRSAELRRLLGVRIRRLARPGAAEAVVEEICGAVPGLKAA